MFTDMAIAAPSYRFSDTLSLLASEKTSSVAKKLSPIERLASRILDYLLKPGFGHKEFSYTRSGRELSLQIIKPMSTTRSPQNPILEIYGAAGVGERNYKLPIFKATDNRDGSIEELSTILNDSIQSHLNSTQSQAAPAHRYPEFPTTNNRHLTTILHAVEAPHTGHQDERLVSLAD